MSEFINTIDILGDEAVTKALVERTITEFNDDVLTEVGKYAFYGCAALTSVDLPNVTSIEKYAFAKCALVSADFQKVTSLGDNAFEACASLVRVDFPLLETVPMSTFNSCSKLTDVNLPNATKINGSFSRCSSLEFLDFPKVTQIINAAFQMCPKLKTLILRSTTLCTLGASHAFNNQNPFYTDGAGGTLLVPRSLTTEYPNETNWSVVISQNANNRFLALEDYTIDGTITGEIDWDKLNGGN